MESGEESPSGNAVPGEPDRATKRLSGPSAADLFVSSFNLPGNLPLLVSITSRSQKWSQDMFQFEPSKVSDRPLGKTSLYERS